MKITDLTDSPKETKRFRVFLDNDKHYDFGLRNSKNGTYIDHKDKIKRENYRKRHYNMKREQPYIKNLIPSPALFSYYLLWGDSTSIHKNIQALNKMMHNNI